MQETKARKTAYYGIITALGLILSYVEALIPINFGVPGAKPGLANLVVLLCLRAPYDDFKKNITGAFLAGVLRILLSGFLFGNMFAIAYSLAGFVTALTAEALMERANLRVRDSESAGGLRRVSALRRVAACCSRRRKHSPSMVPPAQTENTETQSTAAGEFGLTSISAVGGVMHNMGQLLVAVVLCGTPVLVYLPWLILFGVIAGLITGILGALLIKRVRRFVNNS